MNDITEAILGSVLAEPDFEIPGRDLEEFASLPDKVRDEATARLRVLHEIHRARSVHAGCKAVASRLNRPGYSAKRLRNLYYEYTRGTDRYEACDWRILVNKSIAPELSRREDLISDEFKDFVHDFLALNQRGKARERFRALLERLRMWRVSGEKRYAIPGYKSPPADSPGCDHPAGWSYTRLMKIKPTKFEQKAISIGRVAASAFRPKVLTTRVGLEVGEVQMFDDQVHDVRVNFIGNRKVQRPLELVAMDCFSGNFVAHGFKPTTLNEEGGRVMLRQEDMVWFGVNWLVNVGWHPTRGTLVINEHGTAKFPDWMIEKISDLTKGMVQFTAGGVDRRSAFLAQFEGVARGNFRIKAGLESSFNLVRNETAALLEFPGQVGRNRDNAPEETEARMRQNEYMILAAEALPESKRQLLRFPFLEWNQFIDLALAMYEEINRRTWHDLEGWEQAGLVMQEWRLTADSIWLPPSQFAALPDPARAVADALLAASPASLTRVRKMSPSEVWHAGRDRLAKAPGHWLALLLPASFGVERRVTDESVFEFADQLLGPGAFRYIARLDSGRWLRPGETFLTFVNPWAPETLYLSDAGGRYIGACPIDNRVSKADIEGIHRKCGEMAKYEKELLLPVARAGAELTRQRIEDAAHNAGVIQSVRDEENELKRLAAEALSRGGD